MNVPAQLNYSHGYFYKLWADSWKVPTLVIFTINIPTSVVCLCHSYETASQT